MQDQRRGVAGSDQHLLARGRPRHRVFFATVFSQCPRHGCGQAHRPALENRFEYEFKNQRCRRPLMLNSRSVPAIRKRDEISPLVDPPRLKE